MVGEGKYWVRNKNYLLFSPDSLTTILSYSCSPNKSQRFYKNTYIHIDTHLCMCLCVFSVELLRHSVSCNFVRHSLRK